MKPASAPTLAYMGAFGLMNPEWTGAKALEAPRIAGFVGVPPPPPPPPGPVIEEPDLEPQPQGRRLIAGGAIGH